VAQLVGREPDGRLLVGPPLRRRKVIAWGGDRLWVVGRHEGAWRVEVDVSLMGAVQPRALTDEWLDVAGTLYVLSSRDLDVANHLYAAAGGSDTPRDERRALESAQEHRWSECTDVFAAWHSPSPPISQLRWSEPMLLPGMLIASARWRGDVRLPRGVVEVAASPAEVRVYADGVDAIAAPITAISDSVDRHGRVSVDGAELWVTEFDRPAAERVLERARAARL